VTVRAYSAVAAGWVTSQQVNTVLVQNPVTRSWTFAVLNSDTFVLPQTVSFELRYTGVAGPTFPSNVTAVVDYGDGTAPQRLSVTALVTPLSHNYSLLLAQGKYTATITLSNLVDLQTFTVSYNSMQGQVYRNSSQKNS
jgi:hypothetical protein